MKYLFFIILITIFTFITLGLLNTVGITERSNIASFFLYYIIGIVSCGTLAVCLDWFINSPSKS